MLRRISLLICCLALTLSSVRSEGIQKIKVVSTDQNFTVTSTFNDTNLVVSSPRLIDTYIDYLVWESIQWGLVRLYAKLGDYFPGNNYVGFDTVNVEHLLTHTSGYPEASSISKVEGLLFQPSEKFFPSNLNAELLKKVIAIRHGDGFYLVFPKWMKKIGMHNTDFNTRTRTILTSQKDLTTWLNLWASKSLLKPDVLNYFFKPQVQANGKQYSYAWELLGDDKLLAYDANSPYEFFAIDAKNKCALYVKSDQELSREACLEIFEQEFADLQAKNNFLPLFLISLGLLILIVVLRKRKRARVVQ